VVSDVDTVAGPRAIPCDVRDEAQVRALVDETVSRFGGLHIMVPNAGVGGPAPLLALDLAAWRAVMAVNLDGVFLSIRYAAPAIIASGGGSIVTIASVTANTGTPLMAHYAAAKAAVVNLTKTAAVELRDHGVRVNALVPGFVDTELVARTGPVIDELTGLPPGSFGELITRKQGRYGTPADVAEAALFLAGAGATFCTGSTLTLDGGLTASLL
jgi:NAD(P)-dependent dehydrogenase (short-subunit alcohol dehydrogenase family)